MEPNAPPAGPVVTVTLHTAIDRVEDGDAAPHPTVTRAPAGKGVNVSRALAILGVPNIATGFVGSAELDLYEKAFADTPTQVRLVPVAGPTRENVTRLFPDSASERHIRNFGFKVTPDDRVLLKERLAATIHAGQVVVFSGSVPPGMTNRDALELIDVVVAAGARVVCDLPGPLLHELGDRPIWIAKPNREEFAAMLTGVGDKIGLSDADLIAAGREASRWFGVLIVTSGAAPAYLFSRGAVLTGRVRLHPSRVRSTVGCGDAMLAGFVAAQLGGQDTSTSFRQALAVGAAAAMDIVPGRFDPGSVDEMLLATSVE